MFVILNIKNPWILALLWLSTLTIFGWSSRAEAQNKCNSEILITINRGACFGACPIYSAQIYANGKVIYKGMDFVKVKGEKQYKISKAKIKELVKAFEQARYFSLQDKYETDENGNIPTDLPSTTTSICLHGKRKTVVNYYRAPKQLGELEVKIERIAGLYELIGPH